MEELEAIQFATDAHDAPFTPALVERAELHFDNSNIFSNSDPTDTKSVADRSECSDQLVYVIDDDLEVRRSMHFLLSTVGIKCWPYANAADFLEHLPNLKPAPILLDIRMPEIDGLELLARLATREIKWPVIVITAHADISIAVKSMKLGAVEFVQKPIDFTALEPMLAACFSQLAAIGDSSANRTSALRLFERLSRREMDVILVLMDGVANKVAARRFDLSVRTIEMHRANALLKLQVKSIAEAVRLANAAGIMSSVNTRPGR